MTDLNNALTMTAGADSFAPEPESSEVTDFLIPCSTQTAELLESGITIRGVATTGTEVGGFPAPKTKPALQAQQPFGLTPQEPRPTLHGVARGQ